MLTVIRSLGRMGLEVHVRMCHPNDIALQSRYVHAFHRVKGLLNGDQLDFLVIDGDHRYAGVRRDFDLWSPLVKKGGFVALHDIVPHKKLGNTCEVDRFWRELKAQRPGAFEIVADRAQGWAGIGILPVD